MRLHYGSLGGDRIKEGLITILSQKEWYVTKLTSTLDINPQDKLNSAISVHAIQNVMIFSLNPQVRNVTNKEGLTYRKRFITNIGFNFWASGNYTLSNNYYFHFKCLE